MNTALAIIMLSYLPLAAATPDTRRIQGRDDLESVAVLRGTPAYEITRVVARVERRQDGYGFCSAARVGERLFLTNYHCDQPCAATQFRMGFLQGSSAAEQGVWLCKRLVHKELRFDYALYEADPVGLIDFPILALSSAPLHDDQAVYAASHPSGKPMVVDRSDGCRIVDATPFLSPTGRMNVTHGCDTEGSSSGAPLLDRDTGYGIALHWGGRSVYNEAIPMSLVIKSLREKAPGIIDALHIVDD